MNRGLRALKDLNSRTFNIDKAPYDEGINLYKKSRIVIREGVTILVGPNGMGKSTLLKTIEHKLEKNNIPVYIYNNKSDGGSTAMQKALNRNMIDVL